MGKQIFFLLKICFSIIAISCTYSSELPSNSPTATPIPPTATPIKLNENQINTYIETGINYRRMEEFQKAIEEFDKILKLEPNHTGALVEIGITYSSMGEFQKAIEKFDQALSLEPNHPGAITEKQRALQSLNK